MIAGVDQIFWICLFLPRQGFLVRIRLAKIPQFWILNFEFVFFAAAASRVRKGFLVRKSDPPVGKNTPISDERGRQHWSTNLGLFKPPAVLPVSRRTNIYICNIYWQKYSNFRWERKTALIHRWQSWIIQTTSLEAVLPVSRIHPKSEKVCGFCSPAQNI